MDPSLSLHDVAQYHEISKHRLDRFAPGPGYLDWATQPDAFRRYHGARLVELSFEGIVETPTWDEVMTCRALARRAITYGSISRLFQDSLALSAWKCFQGSTWSLRVNPSSGNLHPTEGYLICGPVRQLCEHPCVLHYAPKEHALELRTKLPDDLWNAISRPWNGDVVFVGLSSILWREAWKYGERAYRYCQHDLGHAIACVALAAAAMGWSVNPLEARSSHSIDLLLGTDEGSAAFPTEEFDAEGERGAALIAVSPTPSVPERNPWTPEMHRLLQGLRWSGQPNRLSTGHVRWHFAEQMERLCMQPLLTAPFEASNEGLAPAGEAKREGSGVPGPGSRSFRALIHQRRSAVAMDGTTVIDFQQLGRFLSCTLSGPAGSFSVLPWRPRVSLALFVHRILGLTPGLYLFLRNPDHEQAFRSRLRPEFLWEQVSPRLFRLASSDCRRAAQLISCRQEIAADGCFSLGMLSEFSGPLSTGPWIYPRLYWECGVIGQMLYIEAEAQGIRATGIGCFFDDAMHDLLGLSDRSFQSLYHFSVGGAVEDDRLTNRPAYPDSEASNDPPTRQGTEPSFLPP